MAYNVQLGFLPPLLDDGTIDQSNLQSITLRNAGTATVTLGNGMYTLDPKETVSISAVDNSDTLVVSQLEVRFDTGTGPFKRLEILVLRTQKNNC